MLHECIKMVEQEKNEHDSILCKSVHRTYILVAHRPLLTPSQVAVTRRPAMVEYSIFLISHDLCVSMPCQKMPKRMQISTGAHSTYQFVPPSTTSGIRPGCSAQDNLS